MSPRIVISAGHHPGAKGAWNKSHDLWEHDICMRIALKTLDVLKGWGRDAYMIPTGPLSAKIQRVNLSAPLFAVEIHLNSNEGEPGRGTECLYFPGSEDGRRLAEILQESLVSYLKLPDRGIKPARLKGFLRKTVCPAVITESLFLNNDDEVKRYILDPSGIEAIAMAHAWAMFLYETKKGGELG